MFLFLLAKAALTSVPTAHFAALTPLFRFRQAQFVQIFPLKLAPFCKLFAGLGSSSKSAISLLLLSDSRSVLATLSSSLAFIYHKPFGRSARSCFLSSLLSGYDGSPNIHFFPGNDTRWTGNVLSPLTFLDTRVPSVSTEEPLRNTGTLLSHHACFVLSRLRCRTQSSVEPLSF